jgi:hypothetical protein
MDDGRTSSADRPVRLATVDATYDPWTTYPDAAPPARVTFDGESVLSTKAYPYAAGMIPWSGMRVYMLPIGNTYLIGGALNPQVPQGFWQSPDGLESGVEFGHGSYMDTDTGMVVNHDLSVAGDLVVTGTATGANSLKFLRGVQGSASVSFTSATSHTQTVTFGTTFPSTPLVTTQINSGAGVTGRFMSRAISITTSQFTLFILSTDAAAPAATWSGVPVAWRATLA